MKCVKEHQDAEIIKKVAQYLFNRPEKAQYMFGGYNLDYIVLAMWQELSTYDNVTEEMKLERIAEAIDVLYEGVI